MRLRQLCSCLVSSFLHFEWLNFWYLLFFNWNINFPNTEYKFKKVCSTFHQWIFNSKFHTGLDLNSNTLSHYVWSSSVELLKCLVKSKVNYWFLRKEFSSQNSSQKRHNVWFKLTNLLKYRWYQLQCLLVYSAINVSKWKQELHATDKLKHKGKELGLLIRNCCNVTNTCTTRAVPLLFCHIAYVIVVY